MPREISIGTRQTLEAPSTGVAALVFLMIDHRSIDPPIRVVSDTVDYMWEGERWLGGYPFDCSLLSDGERPSEARLRIQNIDRRIAQAIEKINDAPDVSAWVLVSDDFEDNATGEPPAKQPLGTPTIMYRALHLRLTSAKGNALAIEGRLRAWDPTGEPYPYTRATPELLPGLFR